MKYIRCCKSLVLFECRFLIIPLFLYSLCPIQSWMRIATNCVLCIVRRTHHSRSSNLKFCVYDSMAVVCFHGPTEITAMNMCVRCNCVWSDRFIHMNVYCIFHVTIEVSFLSRFRWCLCWYQLSAQQYVSIHIKINVCIYECMLYARSECKRIRSGIESWRQEIAYRGRTYSLLLANRLAIKYGDLQCSLLSNVVCFCRGIRYQLERIVWHIR